MPKGGQRNGIDAMVEYAKYDDKSLAATRDKFVEEAKGLRKEKGEKASYRRALLFAAQAMDYAIAYHKYGNSYAIKYRSKIKVR